MSQLNPYQARARQAIAPLAEQVGFKMLQIAKLEQKVKDTDKMIFEKDIVGSSESIGGVSFEDHKKMLETKKVDARKKIDDLINEMQAKANLLNPLTDLD